MITLISGAIALGASATLYLHERSVKQWQEENKNVYSPLLKLMQEEDDRILAVVPEGTAMKRGILSWTILLSLIVFIISLFYEIL